MHTGNAAKLYVGGVEAVNATDVNVGSNILTADAKRRGSRVVQKVGTLYEYAITCRYLSVAGDTLRTTIHNAFINQTPLAVAAEDSGDAYGDGFGLRGLFIVTGFPRDEPLEDGITYDLTFEPAFSATDPYWG